MLGGMALWRQEFRNRNFSRHGHQGSRSSVLPVQLVVLLPVLREKLVRCVEHKLSTNKVRSTLRLAVLLIVTFGNLGAVNRAHVVSLC
jgi:hypothetical protein